MDTTGMVLIGIAAVLLFVYMARRRSRLSRED
jgi:LPXTG-motif cell wall-anchored protein